MQETKTPTIILTLIVCSGNKFVTAKFYGTVAQAQAAAIGWAKPRFSYCALHESNDPEEFLVPDEALELWNVISPTCEHGLSAQLCAGPQHYPYDSDEIAIGRYQNGGW